MLYTWYYTALLYIVDKLAVYISPIGVYSINPVDSASTPIDSHAGSLTTGGETIKQLVGMQTICKT